MDMEMINQNLAPGVQDGEYAGFAFKLPLGIGGKGKQGFFYGRKQKGEQFPAIGARTEARTGSSLYS